MSATSQRPQLIKPTTVFFVVVGAYGTRTHVSLDAGQTTLCGYEQGEYLLQLSPNQDGPADCQDCAGAVVSAVMYAHRDLGQFAKSVGIGFTRPRPHTLEPRR